MSTGWILATAGVLLSLGTLARADPEPTVAALREAVLRAKDRPEAYAAYKAYFQRLGPRGLKDLAKDADTGIALQAIWEVHKKPVKRPKTLPGREDEIFDPDELAKFLSLLKERTKAPVPEWWGKLIVDVDLYMDHYHKFPAIEPTKGAVGPKLHKSKTGHLVPDGAELEKNGDSLLLKAGGRSVEIRPESLQFWGRVAALVTEKRSIVACYPDCGVGYVLTVQAGNKGAPAWNADVWAIASDLASSGPEGFHRVELREQNDLIYVFGADIGGLYFEAFETAAGKCRFRFNTTYWGKYSETWKD